MELIEVDAKQLDEYVLNSYKPHYLQTSTWGEVNRKRGLIPHFLQLKDNNRIVGSAMLVEKKILKYSTFYCPRGFICDYSNKEDIKNMVHYLKEYVIKHNGLYLKIDPDIIIRKLDNKGNVIFEDKNNLELIEYLKSLGGTYRGFTKLLRETSAPRFTFRLDINKSEENLYNGFVPSAKRLALKQNLYNVDIIKGDKSNLKDFYFVMQETLIRKKMYPEPYSFYETFFNTLYDADMADIYLVVAYKSKLLNYLNEQLQEANDKYNKAKEKLEKADNKTNQNSVKENEKLKISIENKIAEVNELEEERNVISSQLVVRFKDMIWTIHGGNNDKLGFLRANYEIHFKIFKDAMAKGYKVFDFYGVEGTVDKNSPAYGLYVFKSQFGADYDEFIGEFDFVTKPLANSIITFLLKIRRKLKYYLQKR